MIRSIATVICLVFLGLAALNATADTQKTMTIQVREGQLRATPSHFGKIVAKVSYGNQVTLLENNGPWKKVSLSGGKVKGWIHDTALSSKKIDLKSGQDNVSASVNQKEIALAGKGFSKEVEAQYRQTNKNLDYAWINRMETFQVSSSQMQKFIAEGRLALSEEGGK
jgi:hypothetical protein